MSQAPMGYREHPLQAVSRGRESLPLIPDDQTPPEFPWGCFPGGKERLKRSIGLRLYPLMNRLTRSSTESKLREIGVDLNREPKPTSLSYGKKGTSIEIFLSRLARVAGTGCSFASFGCGMGQEFLSVAKYLRPRSIIGYEFFNYRRAWGFVAERVLREYGIPVTFVQVDLRQRFVPKHDPVEILYSSAVLEHLRDMDESFAIVRPLMRPDGWFAAQWGPMWYSFSGDHIAAELGNDFGFEHVRLSADDYLKFYREHPRNRDTVARGEPTWLELGLSNFARYDEYIDSIQSHFGRIQRMHWQVSTEAFEWRSRRRGDWDEMLAKNSAIGPLDLVLQQADVIARSETKD